MNRIQFRSSSRVLAILLSAVLIVSCGKASGGDGQKESADTASTDSITTTAVEAETAADAAAASTKEQRNTDDEDNNVTTVDNSQERSDADGQPDAQTYWFTGLTADEILERLSLEEKIKQMLLPGYDQADPLKMRKWDFGAVFGVGNGKYFTSEEWRNTVSEYQKAALESKTGLPIIYGQDDVHGVGYCSGAVVFPHHIGLGAANDAELMHEIGAAVADEAKITGQLWNYSPCVAVSTDPRWGRTYESLSSNSLKVNNLARAYTEGLVENGLVACAKHFFADGSETWGTGEDGNLIDRGDASLDDDEIEALMYVYQSQIDAGVQTIMLSHGSVNGVKMHENAKYIRVLREEMGFDGMIVSDYEAIMNISGDSYKEQLIHAINAGVDMLMEPNNYEEAFKLIRKAVKEGSITEERIDEAVRRILQFKIDVGIMDDPMQEKIETKQAEVGSEEYRALAERAVSESLVLLKNNRDEKAVLPIRKGMKVYVTGPAADDASIQCGGWTREWYDPSGPIAGVTTILEGLKEVGEEKGITVLTDPKDAAEADVTLLFIGEQTYAEWFGDSEDISLTGSLALEGNAAAIEEAKRLRDAYGIPTAACIVAGRQVMIRDYLDDWDAAVMCYLPGSEGRGVADVLMGDIVFQGKLPMPWYASTDQIGSEECLFEEGYGLESVVEGRFAEDAPSVIVNGTEIELGTMLLQEFLETVGMDNDLEYDPSEQVEDESSPLYVGLKDSNLRVMLERPQNGETSDIEGLTVCGVAYNAQNEYGFNGFTEEDKAKYSVQKDSTVTIGGICVGCKDEEADSAFGAPSETGSFNDGYSLMRGYRVEGNTKIKITSTLGEVDSVWIYRPSDAQSDAGKNHNINYEDWQKWEESESTKEVLYGNDLILRIPESWVAVENEGVLQIYRSVDEKGMFQCSVRKQELDASVIYGNEEDLYARMSSPFEKHRIDHKSGLFLDCPAVFYNIQSSEEDGETYDEVGVVFAMNNCEYEMRYKVSADDDENRAIGEKILSSTIIKDD